MARLYTDGRFEKQLRDQFDGDFKISFNLAPPLLGGGTDALGRPQKRAFGAWMMPVFRMLAGMRGLRGTAFDIFGHSADRKLERELIAGYEKDVAAVLGALSPVTLETAVELLSLPDRIRGYGPVKEKAAADAKGGTRNWSPISPTRRPRRARSRRSRATSDRTRRPRLTICVMSGLVPGIHVFTATATRQDVDGRDEHGHDAKREDDCSPN